MKYTYFQLTEDPKMSYFVVEYLNDFIMKQNLYILGAPAC